MPAALQQMLLAMFCTSVFHKQEKTGSRKTHPEDFYSFCPQIRFMILQITMPNCCLQSPGAPVYKLLNIIYNFCMKSQGQALQYEEIEFYLYGFDYYHSLAFV